MPLVELLAHPLARLATLTLLHFLWQGVAIAVLLAVVVQVGRIRSVQARYACSLAALALMIACPLATFGWLAAQRPDVVLSAEAIPMSQRVAFSAAPSVQAAEARVLTAGRTWLDAVQPYAFAAWLLGVGLLAARLAAGAIGVWRLRQSSYPLPAALAALVQRLSERMGLGRLGANAGRPLVALSRRVTEAVALGVMRPLVLLPAAWASEMPLPMLEAVLAHELAHLARRDLLVNLLQRIVETLLFYHPAVWWLSRRLRIERELCCDEQAIAATGRRLEYVQALAHVAQRGARVELQLAAGIRGEDQMQLLQRVRNVLGTSGAERPSRLWPAGLAALTLPTALWLLSIGLGAAAADEEREGDAPREQERAERVEREGGRPRREGEREVPREGDRPRDEREVDRPQRDGERPAREGGDRPPNRERIEADLSRVPEGAAAELKGVIRRLMAENEGLRQELAALRREREALARRDANRDAARGMEAEAIERIVREVLERRRAEDKRAGADEVEARKDNDVAVERERAQAAKREAIEREQARLRELKRVEREQAAERRAVEKPNSEGEK